MRRSQEHKSPCHDNGPRLGPGPGARLAAMPPWTCASGFPKNRPVPRCYASIGMQLPWPWGQRPRRWSSVDLKWGLPCLSQRLPESKQAVTRTFQLTSRQWLPRAPEEVFAYFSEAFNLEDITPPWLRCRVVTPAPIEMGTGTEIDYRLRLRGLPLRWRSRISDWNPPVQFVDDQVVGPYRLWHHVHTFEAQDCGTSVVDYVEYSSAGGRLVNVLFLRRDLREIFTYRQQRLAELFGADPDNPPRLSV